MGAQNGPIFTELRAEKEKDAFIMNSHQKITI
jgi:hypothetical protein